MIHAYIKKKYPIAVGVLSVVLILLYTLPVHAVTAANDKGTVTASADDTYIYISYEGTWDYNIQEAFTVYINDNPVSGAYEKIILNTGNQTESQELTVRNAWYSPIEGAFGTAVNKEPANGIYKICTWNIQVPVSTYTDAATSINNISLGWNGQTLTVYEHTVNTEESDSEDSSEDTSTDETSSEDTSTDEATSEDTFTEETSSEDTSTEDNESTEQTAPSVSSGLVIDGYYDDWTGYPITEITYTSNNTKSIHVGQIYTDGDRVYVHFAMNDLYTNQMQVQQMTITLNGVSHTLGVYPVTADHNIDWNYYNNQMNALPNGTYTNLGVIIDYRFYCDSDVAMTIHDSSHQDNTKGDEIEFSFSLEDYARITGQTIDQVSSITIHNPNIGSEGVSWVGSSTGPWILAVIAILLGGIGYYIYKKKDHTAC